MERAALRSSGGSHALGLLVAALLVGPFVVGVLTIAWLVLRAIF